MLRQKIKGITITFDYESDIQRATVFINATEMAKPFDKDINEFLGLQSTCLFISHLINHLNMEHDPSPIEEIRKDGSTWLDYHVALEFARWLNVPLYLGLQSVLRNDNFISEIMYSKRH